MMGELRLAKKRLGDLLVDSKIITGEQLTEALHIQKQTGERLGQALINLGFAKESEIINALEMQLGIPKISLEQRVDPVLIKSLPESLIRRHGVIPVSRDGNRMIVAMFDPLNVVALDDIRLATGYEVDPVIASQTEIDAAIHKVFGLSFIQDAFGSPEKEESNSLTSPTLNFGEDSSLDDSPVVRLVNMLIRQAVNERASDIHIEPLKEQVRVRFRIDGLLHENNVLPRSALSSLVTRIKILAQLDIAEKRLPQDGRFQVRYGNKEIDLRISTLPTVFGEKVVMRLLAKSASVFKIEQLGFNCHNLRVFQGMIQHSYGMILITGPTGSGKTTSLYAVINELNKKENNIITIEDPVEYVMPGVNQTQVNAKAGFTFATGLRSILRQDPDIIMIGEIRDAETASIAVKAATTGHLVLSTLHTNDATGAVTRLIDMGVEPFLVASSVIGVVCQRLVRILCPQCKEMYSPPADSPEREFLGLAPEQPVSLYRPKGCVGCSNIGYKGRTSLQEVLPISQKIRLLTKQRASDQEIKSQAQEEGMITMREDGIRKAMEGVTSLAEVMRVTFTGEEKP
ncbi:GspE/PulE family protein [Desulforamulus ruminis]|uniref:Type II secretion system protein E n=1 Tax=Desulforamulus ruminis (strain ATCC 23193 / DSM 2154 / NCIMB 8452 / DL) TaxID=696281 RepID=F6DUD8_DESRL|nr:type II secretion system protein E [Desulforamulus ruminis DSM 2154]